MKKKKIEKIKSKYKDAKDKNSQLIIKLKEKDSNFNEKLNDEINNIKKNNDIILDNNVKEKNELKNEINNKNNIINELNEKIKELQNNFEKINLKQNEYEEKIKNLNSELEKYKNMNFDNNENNINKNDISKFISINNTEAKDSNKGSVNNKILDEQKSASSDFFEKKQRTGQFGVVGDDNSMNVKSMIKDEEDNNKNIEENKEEKNEVNNNEK